ncbi:alkaline shock response membrane anchor protein AmaP [Nocardiopsis exhalans]|uniref:DUF6286 domain-containing protein n=2 Tax=Nocardiopsis TaxID=2013 RepID=A0A840W9L1_9ACTN|nr:MULTISPECIES: DUF6286 domain-containing protein [Nocardiopsis]MBB5493740.1 hypothetical protein [Nocardiopsis metallicus]USY20370.1 alkaline shock response membrane anchor protein AmaP [Nocardiopsis exhalans]
MSATISNPGASDPTGSGMPPGPAPSEADARSAHRVAVRTFRPRRSTAAVVVSTVTVLVAGLAAAELIAVLVGAPLRFVPLERVSEPAIGARWAGPEMIIASATTAVIGLYLLLTALVPGQSSHMVLRTDDRDLVVGLSRRGLCRIAESAAQEVDGVAGARARIRSRTVRVMVRTPEHTAPGLRTRVESGVRERVLELGPARPVRVRAKVRPVKGGLR